MTQDKILAIISNLKNVELKLQEASGYALGIELRIRWLGQLVFEQKNVSEDERKLFSKYYECNLNILESEILKKFDNQLTDDEKEKIRKGRILRNKLFHADFVGLLEAMNISPKGRFSNNGMRNILEKKDMIEAIIAMERNGGFELFREKAIEIINIFEKLLINCIR